MLSALLIAVWIVLVCISQYFMNWVQFGKTGLIVVGVLGFIGAVLFFLGGYGRANPGRIPTWL